MTLPNDIRNIFFETLHGDISVFEFEKWLYADKSLEKSLTPDDYLNFISLNYKSSEAKYCLCHLIEKHISLGDYEKWRLLNLLTKALKRDNELPNILMTFYDLYCSGYSFFDNLGLGYGLAIVVPYSHGADSWDQLSENKKKELLDSFYPNIVTEIKKVIFWLENEAVVPTGTHDDYDHFLYIDNRNEDEIIPTAY
jgi:hypothetical protein